MDTVRYGIVGTGYFGAEMGRSLAARPGSLVAAVHDPENVSPVAVELGARVAGTVEELCNAGDVDVVVVASPNWAHLEPVLLAAQSGKHVFCEKPIALTYADCAAMVEATAAAGVLFMAGHVTHFMAGVRRTKQLINEGVIGDVIFCRAVRTGWEEPKESVSWKKRRELSGGHLYHHIHELDLVQAIMGPATVATMVGGNVAHQGTAFGDEDDMLVITLEFGENRFAAMEYGSAFRWPEHHILIQGTLGAIRIDMRDVSCELRTADRSEKFLLHRSQAEDEERRGIQRDRGSDGPIIYGSPQDRPPLWLRGIIDEELDYFQGLLQGKEPLAEFKALTDGSAATAAIATADALTLSLRESRKVRVAEITSGP
ncbi:MAG: Gfo/Idh/MocA family oxidoreductase [Propionibacteriaceae bacterium]|nr:Gfo/Idh/MocA family oxidoreductase [Propionibacteriaceae bacterium]